MEQHFTEALKIVSDIKAQEEKIIELNDQLNQKKKRMAIIEEEMMSMVLEATDANGKALYSNETKRKNALLEAVRNDETATQLEKNIRDESLQVQHENAQLNYLRNMLSVYKYLGGTKLT